EVIEADALGPDYWWRNVRNPVRFAEAAGRLINEGYRIFLEIGPRAVLKSYLTDALRSAGVEGRVLISLSRTESDQDPFPAIAARCHTAGYDWSAGAPFNGPLNPRGIPLYRWQREQFWFGRTAEAIDLVKPQFDHPLLGFRQNGGSCWVNHLDRQTLPWIADHAIEGVAVLPAAAVLEMAFAAAQWRWPAAPVLEIADLEIRHPLSFAQSGMRELRTSLVADDWELASRLRLSNEPLTLHASGRLSSRNNKRCELFSSTIGAPPRKQIEADRLYGFARLTGINYGPRFRTVKRIEITGSHNALAHLEALPAGGALDTYLLNPALLDGALQALLGLLAAHSNEMPEAAFLPWRFGRACLWAPFGRVPGLAKVQLTRIGVRSISADIILTDEKENVVAELADCWFRRVELNRRGTVEDRALRVDLLPAPLSVPGIRDRIVDLNGIISRLAILPRNEQARRQEQALLLEALIGSVALASLERFIERGRSFHLSDLVESRQIAPHSAALAESLLRLLERFGAASEIDSEWRIEFSNDLPGIPEVWRLLLAEAPDLVAELALVAAAADDLPVILADGPRQSGALASPMVEQLVNASPASASDIGLLCDVLAEIVKAWPPGQPLRVLELGSNGGATGRILHLLKQSGVVFAYMIASADTEQATRSLSLTDTHFSVSSCQWSPRDGIEALRGEVFDIILAVNACSRLHLDTASLVVLRELLVCGGLFLAIEPEPNPLWDIVFGQNASWWLGGSQPHEASPLRSAEDWRAALAAAGFPDAGTLRSGTGPWPSAFFWGIAPERSQPVRSDAVEPALVTIIGGDTPFRTALQRSLNKAGLHTELALSPETASDDADNQRIFVFLAEPSNGADPTLHISEQIIAVARLATTASERSAVLWVVTSEAHQATLRRQPDHLVGSALWGFARTLVNEMPRLSIRLLDLPGTASPGERAKMVAAELTSGSEETEVIRTPQGRHVLRVHTGFPLRWAEPSDVLSLEAIDSGGRSPSWVVKERRLVGPDEVEIEVHATGLNFRDIMWAKGLVPEEALIDGFAGSSYGLECAGIVSAVGPEVANLAVGDRVMAFAPASLSTHVVTVAEAVAPIPPQTSFADAATVPVTFVTVTYALGHLAKLAPSEHVLIHAAAGGVGLAAIQYAKQRGAIVIATAGSEVKRAFLRLAGADHVFDSRDLTFGDAVRELTGGQGVDVVLNSLGGEAMERSLEVLKPFGRFLELGKVDLYLNRRIRLRPLRNNISYFAIDIDQLPVSRPDLARGLLAEISAALFQGEIRPLAHRIFSFAELDEAFRLMQSSGHIGKLVLQPDGN
ncbi:MAG: polyketide synthase dehydratase domain-containing protein, partial [Alphaproteobacteria bacterium]|nr:polyketide synthase dehydratase domain-containing protein [Alphaproteobacteria bacterium]